jgi:nucleoside-diphosphate-sugar epimerase
VSGHGQGCVVIAGAGDVGLRLARLRAAGGENVVTLRRQAGIAERGIIPVRADLVTGEGIDQLPRQAQAVVFCAAPDRRDEAAYRALFVDGLRRVRDWVDTPRVVFVSSTAVYAEDAGELVDESTPERPPAFNGQALLDAERELAQHPGAIVLRLTGLYGPGRQALLSRARSGAAGRPHWTNRIHVDDAASALSHLLNLAAPQRLYLGSDDAPALQSEVIGWLRQREGLDAVAPVHEAESGRRVSNARLRASGWAPVFTDFRSGYAQVLGAQAARPDD